MRRLVWALVTVGIAGCGSSPATKDMSLAAMDMAHFSACGHPGDKGNSRQIGAYCDEDVACPKSDGGIILICSNITNAAMPPNQATYFCTTSCATSANGTADVAECGENAMCLCRTVGCGCVPAVCAPVNG